MCVAFFFALCLLATPVRALLGGEEVDCLEFRSTALAKFKYDTEEVGTPRVIHEYCGLTILNVSADYRHIVGTLNNHCFSGAETFSTVGIALFQKGLNGISLYLGPCRDVNSNQRQYEVTRFDVTRAIFTTQTADDGTGLDVGYAFASAPDGSNYQRDFEKASLPDPGDDLPDSITVVGYGCTVLPVPNDVTAFSVDHLRKIDLKVIKSRPTWMSADQWKDCNHVAYFCAATETSLHHPGLISRVFQSCIPRASVTRRNINKCDSGGGAFGPDGKLVGVNTCSTYQVDDSTGIVADFALFSRVAFFRQDHCSLFNLCHSSHEPITDSNHLQERFAYFKPKRAVKPKKFHVRKGKRMEHWERVPEGLPDPLLTFDF